VRVCVATRKSLYVNVARAAACKTATNVGEGKLLQYFRDHRSDDGRLLRRPVTCTGKDSNHLRKFSFTKFFFH
jgi:hypothetical protein